MKKRSFLFFFILIVISNCGNNEDPSSHENEFSTALGDSILVAAQGQVKPRLSVQVAAFHSRESAENLISQLENSLLPTYIISDSVPNPPIHRIRIGPFVSDKRADEALDMVKKMGHSQAYLVTENKSVVAQTDQVKDRTEPSETEKKQLTFKGQCGFPRWAPNGREIAFFKQENRVNGIYTVGTGGGLASNIIVDTERREITPKFAWSPGGDKIAFVAKESHENWDLIEALYLIHKDGSGLKVLFHPQESAFDISNLKWSPNGQHIAFDATYGQHSDLLQRVMIVSLNGRRTSVPSQFEKTNRLVGWQNNRELIFLSAYEQMNHSMALAYEVWKYDLNSGYRIVLLEGPVVKSCQMIEYWRNKGSIIYSAFDPEDSRTAKLCAVNLGSRTTTILMTASSNRKLSKRFFISNLDQLYFLYGDKLWQSDWLGKRTNYEIHLVTENFTLSPGGTKLCLEENGHLFTLSLAQIKKKARY